MEQGADHAPQPARVIERTPTRDDLQALLSREAGSEP
jgi:hypothetical protein